MIQLRTATVIRAKRSWKRAAILLACWPSLVQAQPALRIEGGTRTAPAAGDDARASGPSTTARATPPPSHKVGRAPRTPLDRLPDGVPLSQPNERARRSIAEGPTRQELAKTAPDAELRVLQEVDKVLFPRPVRGLVPNWSFDLPEAGDSRERTLGLPLTTQPQAEAGVAAEDREWLRSLTMPDLPVRLDQRVVTYLEFYRDSHRGRTIAAIWARKSGRYVSSIKAMFRRAGLPTDLVWLSLIESGHDPTIRSPAGAVGLWQFIPETGRMYGLTVDRWVDERRDPARSTEAAIRFLSDLYQRFGNWELAMASYNMGYAGMSRAITKYNSNDYWTLSRLEGGIPWETSLYVPKIFALAIVMNNRQAFGLGRIKPDPSVSFDSIVVEAATPLSKVAEAADIDVDQLRELNPQLLSSRVPPLPADASRTAWRVRVPSGTGARAQARLANNDEPTPKTYVAKFGDDLSRIADSFQLSERSLRELNGLATSESLRPGTVLLLPRTAQQQKETPREAVVVSRSITAGSGQRRVFFQVLGDHSLEEVAEAFSVRVADLVRYNALDADARLRPNMTLQVLVSDDQELSGVRHFEAKRAKVLVAGSPEFHEYHEAKEGNVRLVVTVSKGDTLRSIGHRYGMSVGSMERVNRRSRSAKLVPGETLVVYTSRAQARAAADDAPKPLPDLDPPRPELLPKAP